MSWPASTPQLKSASATANAPAGISAPASASENPRPCTSPKKIVDRPPRAGAPRASRFAAPTQAIESAIAISTGARGRWTTPGGAEAERQRVREREAGHDLRDRRRALRRR